MFNNLNDNVAVEDNRLGGGFQLKETDVYTGKIKMAYGDTFDSGAMFIQLNVELDDGSEYRERLIVTNKEGKNFYIDKKTGVERGLPGFTIANDICLVTLGIPLSEVSGEEKTVKVYDYEAQAEVPQTKYVLMDLIDKEIKISIRKIKKNKQAKNDSTGKYENINEAQEINEIHTVFDVESNFTTTELRNQVEEPEFHDKWLEKYKGVEIDNFKEVKGGSSKPFGAAKAGATAKTGNPFKKS